MAWAFPTGDSIGISSPAMGADGTVYVGSDTADGKLHAINGSSGLADSVWSMFRGDLRQSGKHHYFARAPRFEYTGALEDGTIELIVQSRPTQTVSVEASPEFGAWSPVATASSSNGALRFLSPPQPALRHLFFRAFGP